VATQERLLGTRATTLFGIGATIGGGAIVLAGPAIEAAGAAVLLAVLLNGALCALAALSLAELGARFPRSGGPYAFAKQVFSVHAAFAVGWLVWTAALAAAAVFALGFATFLLAGLSEALRVFGAPSPPALDARVTTVSLALATLAVTTLQLARGGRGGGAWLTLAKVGTFALLGGAGMAAAWLSPEAGGHLRPFAPNGARGVAEAMGLLFVAFQGFALVAATAGDVRAPARTLPRAMLGSLAVATGLYALLFVTLVTVGVPSGGTLLGFAAQHGATAVSEAARVFLGEAGYALVTLTALLATFTALQAHLFAASRIARAMGRDRTLPSALAELGPAAVPRRAVVVSALGVAAIAVALPNVGTAAAAAGLIYLTIFALTHVKALLARLRAGAGPFRTPGFALLAPLGAASALGLALANAVTVPTAGVLVVGSLALGAGIYLWLLAQGAATLDAEHEGAHPDLVQLRGRRPLVLVPIANPANAEALVTVASALAPPRIGRVTLLTVVPHRGVETSDVAPLVSNAQDVLRESLGAAIASGLYPEALTTVAADPWAEIGRVARDHDCEILLLGLTHLDDVATLARLDALMASVRSDVVILRAPPGWHLEHVRRVVVPFAGRGDQERLRARLLGALARLAGPEVEFLRIVPPATSDASLLRFERTLADVLEGRELGRVSGVCLRSDDLVAAVTERAAGADLLIVGLPKRDLEGAALGPVARRLAAEVPPETAMLMIHRR
jgi:basic amino acid/polyamine antiporter, APA family